jgi:Tol biopolymer transport system component
MPLTAGAHIGRYEILAAIGVGGMGEVYRARDTKLDRDVAIKILPESVAADPERIARFEREAKTLAALNHPHIAHIHGLEEANDSTGSGYVGRALVMELVEGPTLADRIAGGPLPVDEALPIARQIADALEAAHAAGIIHRDLKPANIKVRSDGTVKVLDFGLAKALDPVAGSGDVANSPTLTFAATQAGVILGTAAYMSPEQIRGKAVDKRADIWAFGAVVYEMLTGQRAFQGEDTSLTLAEVMKSEPDWTLLPADISAGIRGVLKRCLQKDRLQRLHDIADVRLLMDEAAVDRPDTAAVVPRRRWAIAIASGIAAATLAVAGSAIVLNRKSGVPLPVMRATFVLPEGQIFTNSGRRVVAISPDGSRFAYVANLRLYLRPLSELDATPITEIQESDAVLNPVFSPDGRSIAFWSPNTIKRISVGGGPAVTICEASRPFGMSWHGDTIVFGQGGDGIKQVSASGGKPETLVTVRPGEIADGPQVLPGGQAVLFTIASESGEDRWDKARIVAQPLAGGARKTIIDGGSGARYLPTGHLLYTYQGVLLAVPFDLGRLEAKGSAVPVVEGVLRAGNPDVNSGAAHFDVSNAGLLIYAAGSRAVAERSLAFIDRRGGFERLKLPPGLYETPRVSPDGKRIAYSNTTGSERSIYIYDLSSSALPRRLTFGGRNRFPIWSADGLRVAFQSDRDSDLAIFWQRADGTDPGERLTRPEPGTSHVPNAWSPQGDALVYTLSKNSVFTAWSFSMRERKAEPLSGVTTPVGGGMPQPSFSPDGHWLAYRSVEPGSTIYVQPFPGTGARYQITSGSSPVWSRDGTKLFFTGSRENQLGVVSIDTRRVVTTENRETFDAPLAVTALSTSSFDVAPDGRILVPVTAKAAPLEPSTSPRIHIVANWFEELKARVPAK